MSNKTKSLIKAITIIVVTVLVLLSLDVVSINLPFVDVLMDYKFWIMVIAFALMLVISR
ncbi:MAG TPA: hypothetical protein ACFCUD_06720 [Cyclobacteriaceae bacterium]